jgi:hypothetical protein
MTEWELTPAAKIDAIISSVVAPLLLAADFRPGARRRWVRSYSPIRHVFEIAAMKGATLIPRWGFSLDFVPHVKGNAIAWHRTDRSSTLDLVYDPVDFDAEWESRWAIQSLHGADGVRRDAERVLPGAVRAARGWLDGAVELASVLERAEWLRTAERPGQRFTFENFVQQPLAYAFLLSRSGYRDRAHQELDAWITMHSLPHLRDKLMTLLRG